MDKLSHICSVGPQSAGYLHSTAAEVMKGLLQSAVPDELDNLGLTELAYEIAAEYVREAALLKEQKLPGVPKNELPLVFKHALIFLSDHSARLVHRPNSHKNLVSAALKDAIEYVSFGRRVNEHLYKKTA